MTDTTPQAEPSGSAGPKSRVKDILKLVLFLGIGFFFIYWFLLKLDASQKAAIWDSFIHADYLWVAAAMACCLLSHLVRALRWQLLYQPLGCRPRLNSTFGSVVVAYMANLAFPRLGEVMRCATLSTSDGIPIEKSLGTVVTERIVDVLLFFVIVLAGLLVMYADIKDWLYDGLIQKINGLPSLPVLCALLAALALAAWLVYKYCWKRLLRFQLVRKIDHLLHGCLEGLISIFRLGTRSTLLFIVYSLLIYALYLMGGLIIFQAFPETQGLGFKAAFALYLFGSIGMTFSQGGLGVYPVLVQMALALYGISLEVGTAAGWLLWSSQQAIVITVGLGYLVYFSLIKKKTDNNN